MSLEDITPPFPMSDENRRALIKHVVHELSKGQPNKLIVEELCRQYGFQWNQTEQFVKEVKQYAGSDITNNKLYVIAGVSALLGIVLLVIAIVAFGQAQGIRQWPTTNAQVMTVDIERRLNTRTQGVVNNGNNYEYIVTAQYQYVVNGQTYGRAITLGRYDTISRAESKANEYRGTHRDVYYNPQNPSHAEFNFGAGVFLTYGAGILGVLFIFATIGMVVFAMINTPQK